MYISKKVVIFMGASIRAPENSTVSKDAGPWDKSQSSVSLDHRLGFHEGNPSQSAQFRSSGVEKIAKIDVRTAW
jgi:hypothetical protein